MTVGGGHPPLHGVRSRRRTRLQILCDGVVNQPSAPAGAYTVEWRVTSADGHPISGSFSFTAEAAGAESSAPSLAPVPSTAPIPGGPFGLSLLVAAVLVLVVGLLVAGQRRWTRKDRSLT